MSESCSLSFRLVFADLALLQNFSVRVMVCDHLFALILVDYPQCNPFSIFIHPSNTYPVLTSKTKTNQKRNPAHTIPTKRYPTPEKVKPYSSTALVEAHILPEL